jgi:hypothetical protein
MSCNPLASLVTCTNFLFRGYLVPGACLVLAACLDRASPPVRDAEPPLDASEPPHVLGLEVLDALGHAWPERGIPRAPRLRLLFSTPMEGEVLLLTGAPDSALVADLAAPPLRSTTLARAISCQREVDGARVELRPNQPLLPGAELTLAVPAWARDAVGRRLGTPFVRSLRVANSPIAGARAVEAWPPDGAVGIGVALPFAAVRFDGEVRGVESGVFLEGPDGFPVPSSARPASCTEIGWEGGQCALIVPGHTLVPGAVYRLRTDDALRDATGVPVPPFEAWFTTANEPDRDPPILGANARCAIDEMALPVGCALTDDMRILLRLHADEPIRVRALAAGRLFHGIGPRGEVDLDIEGLGPSTTVPIALEAIDAAGNVRTVEFDLATTEPLPLIAITEVLADPYGSEPRQEWIEIANLGPTRVSLRGFAIADHPLARGDLIEGDHQLPPGGRALLVASEFDPTDRGEGDRDPPIPPGVPLIRVDRALCNGGLSNAGEPLFLRDPAGRRISAAPAIPPPREGVCLVRISTDPRTGAPGTFDYDPGGCTPGR